MHSSYSLREHRSRPLYDKDLYRAAGEPFELLRAAFKGNSYGFRQAKVSRTIDCSGLTVSALSSFAQKASHTFGFDFAALDDAIFISRIKFRAEVDESYLMASRAGFEARRVSRKCQVNSRKLTG